MDKKFLKQHALLLIIVPTIFIMGPVLGNLNLTQPVSAQETNGTNSFSASGYTGQVLTLPSSITQVPVSQNESSVGPAIGSVIGGSWNFVVSDGKMQNFTWNATSYSLTGEVNGTASISGLADAGPVDNSTSDQIELNGNHTSFTGSADILINGETAFEDVPVTLYLLNGHIVSLIISNEDTDGQFPLPLYGIVTSIKQS